MRVLTEKRGVVTTIIINRPEVRNAVDGATARELAEAFRQFEQDDQALAAVLTGEGGYFCAGADLKAVSSGRGEANRIEPEGDGPMGPSRMVFSKPVIAAVAGHAVAGGLELAVLCDMRVVEEDAVFVGKVCPGEQVPASVAGKPGTTTSRLGATTQLWSSGT